MKSIVVFNNKGGVGKTTLLCNLAAFLQIKKKYKILVIDADPQCNATAYMFPYPQIESLYSRKQETIYEVLKPVKRGRGYLIEKLPILQSPFFGIDVLIGDPQLSLAEDFLGKDWIDGKSGDYRGLQTTLVFRDLLSRAQNYDYIIFDVGPSLGALNRSVLLSCDFFVVPMSSDIFSLRAVENISISLEEWKIGLLRGLEDFKNKEKEDFKIGGETVSWKLQFAGYVTQQYTAKTVDGKQQPVNAYEKIIKKIPSTVNKYLLPLNNHSMSYPKIGEITNLHSLVPLSQNSSVPIFALQAKDGVVGAHFSKVRDYEANIGTISMHLMENIKLLS